MAENEQIQKPEIQTAPAAENAEKSTRKPRRRPAGKFGHSSKNKTASFSDTLADRFGEALSNKLKRGIEEDIKRKIKAAQSDPAVQRASAKFGK